MCSTALAAQSSRRARSSCPHFCPSSRTAHLSPHPVLRALDSWIDSLTCLMSPLKKVERMCERTSSRGDDQVQSPRR